MRNKTKDKVLMCISALLLFSGLFGLHNDWTTYVLAVPFGWGLIGLMLDIFINNRYSTRESIAIASLCSLVITNVALILVHNDISFVLGRLLCCIGSCLMVIRITTDYKIPNQHNTSINIEEKQKALNKLSLLMQAIQEVDEADNSAKNEDKYITNNINQG